VNVAPLPMVKCAAFQPVAGTRKAWIPCARRAEAGSAFCRKHGDAIFGVMLGALVHQQPVAEVEHMCGDGQPCPLAQAQRR